MAKKNYFEDLISEEDLLTGYKNFIKNQSASDATSGVGEAPFKKIKTSLYIPDALYNRFKVCCLLESRTITDVMTELVDNYVAQKSVDFEWLNRLG